MEREVLDLRIKRCLDAVKILTFTFFKEDLALRHSTRSSNSATRSRKTYGNRSLYIYISVPQGLRNQEEADEEDEAKQTHPSLDPFEDRQHHQLKMVVAMASCSLGVNLNSNCSFEKTPCNSITNWGYSRRVLGFGSKSFCIVQKKGRLLTLYIAV
ncbi:hypothetical protein GBA52_014847 [Prunus armeniaca]|nr:hypothetical protein GBA52_014847 [Prunus armeniaca]